METTSESDQDGVTSGEDSSFDRPHATSASGRRSATGSGRPGGNEFAEPQITQSQMQQYRVSQAAAAAAAAAGGMDSQTAMMMSANYLPFMMSTSYPAMMMQGGVPTTASAGSQAAAAASFFNRINQNSLSKDADSIGAAGSPLNLQTGGQATERPRVGPGGDFSGASLQQQQRSMPAASPGLPQARNSPHLGQGSSYPQPAHQGGSGATYGGGQMSAQARFDTGFAGKSEAAAKSPAYPPPPKRPLTPYMRFNKFMWEKVKASNPSMGVCEISASIGRLWRELGPEEKQRHNDEYTLDKARYDEELKAYLKLTGLRSSDLVKQKAKKTKPAPPPAAPPPLQQQVRRPAAAPAPQPAQASRQSASHSSVAEQQQQHAQQAAANHHHQQQQLQALMGLNMGAGSLPIGMPVSFQNMGMLSGFPQMWATAAAGQQYPGGLVSAGQLQELYGGVNGVEAPPPAHNQQSSSAGSDAQTSALYRYPQSFM
jgi:hypothetical protein